MPCLCHRLPPRFYEDSNYRVYVEVRYLCPHGTREVWYPLRCWLALTGSMNGSCAAHLDVACASVADDVDRVHQFLHEYADEMPVYE